MPHPYRPNGVYEHKNSVRYSMSEMTEWGMKKSDLVLVTPIGGYCPGPDGNVWWVPFGAFQSDGRDEPVVCEIPGYSDVPGLRGWVEESESYLSWDIARNCREEDVTAFSSGADLNVPDEVEYAHMVVSYALSLLVEESIIVASSDKFAAVVSERLEEVRQFALWIMSTVDWYAVGEHYA